MTSTCINLFIHHENKVLGMKNNRQLPVTIVTGFLGSGKTTLLNHIIKNKLNLNIVCAVNDFAELNIDHHLVSKKKIQQKTENLIRQQRLILDKGLFCCPVEFDKEGKNLKDIVWKILSNEIGHHEEIDYLVIETSGTTNPINLINLVQQRFGKLTRARLDSVITVVDADSFHPSDVSPVLRSQLQCADLVLLNKMDLLDEQRKQDVRQWVKSYLSSSSTKFLEASYCNVSLMQLLDIQPLGNDQSNHTLVSHENPQEGWEIVCVDRCIRTIPPMDFTPEGAASSFKSFIYETTLPLSFASLNYWFTNSSFTSTFLRVKGFIYLCERHSVPVLIQWSGRGRLEISAQNVWGCVPKTQLVFIGDRMMKDQDIKNALDNPINLSVAVSFPSSSLSSSSILQIKKICSSCIFFTVVFPKHFDFAMQQETEESLITFMNMSLDCCKVLFLPDQRIFVTSLLGSLNFYSCHDIIIHQLKHLFHQQACKNACKCGF